MENDNKMKVDFLKTYQSNFIYKGKNVLLKGVGLGTWLNIEHFMFGIPGTETQIRKLIFDRYGKEKYDEFWDRFYGNYISKEDIKFIYEQGMNHVRVPISYKLFDRNNFKNSIAIKQINRMIKYCEKYGIWIILDLHSTPGGQNPDWHSDNDSGMDVFWDNQEYKDSVIELWKNISLYYKDELIIGGYDIINEPCYFIENGDKLMIEFYKKCTEAIRTVDKNHIIIYEGSTYSRDFNMFKENLDENCAYSFHLYPFLQIPDKLDSPNLEEIVIKTFENDVSIDYLQNVLKKPVWCGETGHPVHLNNKIHVLSYFIDILSKRGISWAIWPYKDIGAMAMVYLKSNGKWNNFCNKVSEGWSFWDSFSSDSILASNKEKDKYSYYKWLVEKSTNAYKKVVNNIKKYDFESVLNSLEDFKMEYCEDNEELLNITSRFTKID